MARKTAYKIASLKSCKVVRFFLFCSILETVYKIVQAVDGHAQTSFIQTEERYLVDGIPFKVQNSLSSDNPSVSFTELEDETLQTFASPIIFQPSALDFGIHSVGMPQMERVYVQNPSMDTSLHLLSISGSTLHFHCSFFQEKVIAPGGNTSFDVVFLARQEGHVENTLFIHTSLGSFKYQVMAIGAANPYRLQPFLRVRMPMNSSYSPLIHMHNPHSSTLQLTEIYTSGGDLHLELPFGEAEAPKTYWTIPPYETRTVMRANFIARVERNHTSYIRIKTNNSLNNYLVVPVEVEVSSAPGIYSPSSVLDFGVLCSQDEPKTISLSLLNSGHKHIHIVNTIVAPVNEAIEIKFSAIKIPPDTLHSTEVANITFFPSRATHHKQCTGKIVIKTKNNQFKLAVPYQVTLLQGSLSYNSNVTRFYVGQESRRNMTHVRHFSLVNNFNITLVVHAASLPAEVQPYFSINFSLPVLLPPGQSVALGWLIFNPSERNIHLTTHLHLLSNVSHFDVPLVCFSGKLQLFLPQGRNQSYLDFGTLGVEEKRSLIFAVINENPVDVNLRHWGSNTSKAYVELLGLNKGNISMLARRHTFSDLSKSLTLKPEHYAIFRVGITAPSEEGIYIGESFLETQYEVIKIPYSLRTAKGNLIADDLFFDNAFPGKISSQPLYIKSTFSHPLTVTSVVPIPDDPRFIFEPSKISSTLQQGMRNLVGKVLFDQRIDCKQKCYSGLPTTSPMGHQWLLGMSLPSDIGDMDGELYRSLRERWHKVVHSGEKNMNITFRLDTSEVHGFFLRAHATLQWPRLSSKCHLRFPITQINNLTVKDFAIENPSSLPVLVQVVPLHLYPGPESVIRMLAHKLGGETAALKHVNNVDAFSFTLQDLEQFNPRVDNSVPTYRKSLEEYFGVPTHKQTIAMLLTPGMRVRVRVGFSPIDDFPRTSLVLIRNNLTVVDALVVQGQGGSGQIRFGNKDPGTDSTLMFELSEKHLKSCEETHSSNRFPQPNFTVRRAFTARNTGELPVYISGFDINGSPCEGYGFRVLHCNGFELKPNTSRKVNIAYTPDFTLSRVERVLNLHTSLGYALPYVLVATLPRHLLSSCSQSLPRPTWETLLYYSVISLLLFLLLCVLMAGILEGDRILKTVFFPMATSNGLLYDLASEPGQLFDLKAISKAAADTKNRSPCSSTADGRKCDIGNCGWLPPTMSDVIGSRRDKNLQCNEWDLNEQSAKMTSRSKSGRCRSLSEAIAEKYLTPNCCSSVKQKFRRSDQTWTEAIMQSLTFRNNKSCEKQSNAATQTTKDGKADRAADSLEAEIELRKNAPQHGNQSRGRIKQFEKNSLYIRNRAKKSSESSSYWEEETSSTTTESSNPESDISEKDQHLPDVVCISAHNVKQKSKSKADPGEKSDGVSRRTTEKDAGDMDDRDFELSTKSKAHKKIKVDPAKAFGGDILQPNTLELPYKPQPVTTSMGKSHSDSPKSASKSSNRIRIGKSKGQASDSERNSSPVFWDDPLPLYGHDATDPDDSLSEMSQQTENFAMHLGMPTNGRPRSLSRDGASYSSIVSGETGGNIPWKTPPSRKSSDHGKFLGRPNSLPLSPDVGSGNKLWKLSPQALKSYDTLDVIPSEQKSLLAENEDVKSIFPSTWSPQSVSVMQDLQAKRRQRMDEYYKQQALSNWPGFDSPSPENSLWDPSYIPSGDSWSSSNSSSAAKQKESQQLEWNRAADALWRPSTSVWPAFNPSGATTGDPLDLLSTLTVAHDRTDPTLASGSSSDFSSFNRLNSIWSPNPGATWNFNLFADNLLNNDKKEN